MLHPQPPVTNSVFTVVFTAISTLASNFTQQNYFIKIQSGTEAPTSTLYVFQPFTGD